MAHEKHKSREYVERLRFYGDSLTEKNKLYTWDINSIFDLEARLRYWMKRLYIRAAWYEVLEKGERVKNERIDLIQFLDYNEILFKRFDEGYVPSFENSENLDRYRNVEKEGISNIESENVSSFEESNNSNTGRILEKYDACRYDDNLMNVVKEIDIMFTQEEVLSKSINKRFEEQAKNGNLDIVRYKAWKKQEQESIQVSLELKEKISKIQRY